MQSALVLVKLGLFLPGATEVSFMLSRDYTMDDTFK